MRGRKEAMEVPKASQRLENMDKHLTTEEREAREQAERDVIPDRDGHVQLKPPPIMAGIAGARGFWKRTLERMEGLSILDDLDSDTLGVYCVMMARYKQQCALLNQAGKQLKAAGEDSKAVADAVAQIDAVSAKMTTLEKTILQYAEKLGLTPSGRIHLARKRAAKAAGEVGDDDDLFGD